MIFCFLLFAIVTYVSLLFTFVTVPMASTTISLFCLVVHIYHYWQTLTTWILGESIDSIIYFFRNYRFINMYIWVLFYYFFVAVSFEWTRNLFFLMKKDKSAQYIVCRPVSDIFLRKPCFCLFLFLTLWTYNVSIYSHRLVPSF